MRAAAVNVLPILLAMALAGCGDAPEGPDHDRAAGRESTQEPTPDARLKPFTGDLGKIRKRKFLRALVTYSRTNYFIDGRKVYGLEYELLHQYERFLNRKVPRGKRRISIVYVPVPFDRLLPALLEGRGDIAAAGITKTAERSRRVAFSRPYLPDVREVVITSAGIAQPATLEDLAGSQIHVLRGSSYVRHLEQLNQRFALSGLAPIEIADANRYLQTEDLLEMANAGIVDLTVADQHIAELWAKVLPNIVLRPDLAIAEGGSIAWALRPDNPELLASVNEFMAQHRKGTLLGNILYARYFEDTSRLRNPAAEKEAARLAELEALFREFAGRYGFDWIMIAAQAFQESRLDHSKVSSAGAVGVMQVLPATAADPNVAIPQVRDLESNIHAGVKYLAFIRDRYFSDPGIDEDARLHLSLAAYNAGPRKVMRMRKMAEEMGLDPNRWFQNVENAALRIVGQETVRYVANIEKYATAYRLFLANQARREEALEQQVSNPPIPAAPALESMQTSRWRERLREAWAPPFPPTS